MALINCKECGKEISDMAIACVHCGCPVKVEENKIICKECGIEKSDDSSICKNCGCPIDNSKVQMQNIDDIEESEIISILLDKKKLKIFKMIYLILGIIFMLVCFIFIKPAFIYMIEDSMMAFFIPVVVFGSFGITFLSKAYLYKKYDRNQLVLTNKRLRGQINFVLSTTYINIPIERIDSVVVVKDFFTSGITMMSNNLAKSVYYVLNAEEFVDKTIKEIEKYKNR